MEIYNPSDEPMQLYSKTILGALTPMERLTDVQLETFPGDEKKTVKEATTQSQSSQTLPEEIQALVNDSNEVIMA